MNGDIVLTWILLWSLLWPPWTHCVLWILPFLCPCPCRGHPHPPADLSQSVDSEQLTRICSPRLHPRGRGHRHQRLLVLHPQMHALLLASHTVDDTFWTDHDHGRGRDLCRLPHHPPLHPPLHHLPHFCSFHPDHPWVNIMTKVIFHENVENLKSSRLLLQNQDQTSKDQLTCDLQHRAILWQELPLAPRRWKPRCPSPRSQRRTQQPGTVWSGFEHCPT